MSITFFLLAAGALFAAWMARRGSRASRSPASRAAAAGSPRAGAGLATAAGAAALGAAGVAAASAFASSSGPTGSSLASGGSGSSLFDSSDAFDSGGGLATSMGTGLMDMGSPQWDSPMNTDPAFNVDGTPMCGLTDIHGRFYGDASTPLSEMATDMFSSSGTDSFSHDSWSHDSSGGGAMSWDSGSSWSGSDSFGSSFDSNGF